MSSPKSSYSPFKVVPVLSIAVACVALGWYLRGPSPGEKDSGASASVPQSTAPNAPGQPAPAELAATTKTPDAKRIIDRAIAADTTNMVDLVEALGDLTRLSDDQVKTSWADLARRRPTPSIGGSAAVIYLWSRMSEGGREVAILPGWGADNFVSTISIEKARGMVPELRRKLESGQSLDDAGRHAVYAAALREDPYGAVMLWMRHTKPWDFQADGRLFGNTLSDPKTRDAIVAEARKWQTDKDLMGALVSTLAKDWIATDPAAVEQWLNQPAQADVRKNVMEQVVNVRALANPADAWQWSATLPTAERHQALGMSAGQLANTQPEAGARLIAGLQDPADREVAVREYGRVLAANNLEQWKKWRDGLPEHERAATNTSAFQLWVFNEPDKAVGWLNTQPASSAKDTMVETLVGVYAVRDPKVAAQWIQSIPDLQRRKEAATSALAAIGPDELDAVRTILTAIPN